MDWPLGLYILLLFTAFVAGFVSSIAGAGGMIVLPVLLWAGVPPLNALAINKFQSVFGTLSSTINFFRKGQLSLGPVRWGLAWAFFGALLGAWVIQQLDSTVLQTLLPWLLLVLAGYLVFSPDISDDTRVPSLSAPAFNFLVGGGLGLYGGFFGPGMGSFFAVAFARLRGMSARAATAHTKPFVLIVNTTSMVVFVLAGYQWWGLAIAMAVMQSVGAYWGSNLVISRGAKLVKPALIIVTVALAIKLLWVG